MTSFSSEQTPSRVRLALIVFLIGAVFLLWGLGTMAYRTSMITPADIVADTASPSSDAPGTSSPTVPSPAVDEDLDRKERMRVASIALITMSLLLLLLFIVGSYALVRSSRKHRSLLADRKAKATKYEDVWSQHVLPEGALDSGPDDAVDPDGDEDADR